MELKNNYTGSVASNILNLDKQNGMVHHAYLLHGTNQNQLNAFALQMAKHILCKNENAPCDNCDTCNNIQKNLYSDVFVFPKKGNSIKVEDANYIVEDSLVTPFESKYKVYLLQNFENTTIPAQNKLLKTLEEPSSHVVFLITTTNLNLVLPTIRSRSKKVFVPSESDFVLTEQQNTELACDLFVKMKKSNDVLFFANQVLASDAAKLLAGVQFVLLEASKVKQQVKPNGDNASQINAIANDFTMQALHELFLETLTVQKQLLANVNKNAVVEHFLMKILEVRFACQQQ